MNDIITKIEKCKSHIIVISILMWGNISAICYLINNNNFVLKKTQPSNSTIFEIIWTVIIFISSCISHFLCYVFGLEIHGWSINYNHVVFMAIQLLVYYLLACLVVNACPIKKVSPENNGDVTKGKKRK